MLLNFFVARLNITPKSKTADVFLRFNVTQGTEDLSAQGAAMANFCFPLGPENQAPKEVLAPEVRGGGRGGGGLGVDHGNQLDLAGG